MIKIIEPGTRTVTECAGCGCKFSYENEDIEKDKISIDNPLFFEKTWVVCPQCGKEIVLETTK